jgi:hypothetical protein
MSLRPRGWLRRVTPAKLLFVVLLFVGCRAESELPRIDDTTPETVISSTPPFQTKEPERYQATRTVTIVTAGGERVVTKTSMARDGAMRRNESETVSKRVAYLDVPEGRFALLVDGKVYADLAESDLPSSENEEISPERLLHSEAGSNTSYQKLGTEVVGGRRANKYRVVVNSSNGGNVTLSETLIWIDEVLNMPIRSETTSSEGTRITMELTEISPDVVRTVFQVPGDYKKITFAELRKRLSNPD